jgi:protein-S-isoprenylcysteine O-methyltransferase Ste14
MNPTGLNGEVKKKSDTVKEVGWVQILKAAFILLALPAVILFGASGRLDWGMAWFYVALTTGFSLASRILMVWKTPGLIEERGQASQKEGVKPWDKVLMPLGLVVSILILIAAGLDKRFDWSPELSLQLQITALAVTALGYSLSTWATLANRFFSSFVRIQRERGHTVVSSGPYRLIRHPGYAGAVVTSFTTPILLGSLWALIPAALAVCILFIRTALEDKTLQEELEGYREYTEKVRYRLLPGMW